MKVSHISFVPVKWIPDRNILNTLINPEVGYFEIPIKDYIDIRTAVNKHPALKTLATMGIKWIYTIENHNRTKEIFYCEANDNNSVDISNFDNEDELSLDIKKSFKRFSDYFDANKIELGLKEHYLSLSENEVDGIRRELLLKLKS